MNGERPPSASYIERVSARLSHAGGGRAVLNTREILPLSRPVPPELEGKRTTVVIRHYPDGRRVLRVVAPDFSRIRPPVPKGPRRTRTNGKTPRR